jgi:thymidylate synthase (FAD)
MTSLIHKVINNGHTSILEHVNLTFAISGISRVASHQLVRYRHASFSQQSQRYTTPSSEYQVPKPVADQHPDIQELYHETVINALSAYQSLVDIGVEKGEARRVLPEATLTNIVVTFNLRELIHICNQRLCKRAQEEIRQMVRLIAIDAGRAVPFIRKYLVPKCIELGYCPEENSCKMTPSKAEVLEAYAILKEQSSGEVTSGSESSTA